MSQSFAEFMLPLQGDNWMVLFIKPKALPLG